MGENRFAVKGGTVALFVGLGMALTAFAQPNHDAYPLEEAKRILFIGNSITYAGGYVSFFECFYRQHYPDSNAEIINTGLPSETVSGLSEPNHAEGAFPRPWLFDRLARLLEKTNPEVAFACYGMNDGIYLPFDETRFEAFKTGMIRLRNDLEQAGVKRIIFLTPPVHDDPDSGLNGYNVVLDRYAQWLLEQRKLRGWEVIDLHFPMSAYLTERRKTHPEYRLAEDGVHPAMEGHWLMAMALFAYCYPEVDEPLNMDAFLNGSPETANLYKLISQRQAFMKDAWLTHIGHDRPGMKRGMPMKQARKAYLEMARTIRRITR